MNFAEAAYVTSKTLHSLQSVRTYAASNKEKNIPLLQFLDKPFQPGIMNLDRILRLYGRIVNFGSHCGFIPYKWENNHLVFLDSWTRRWLFRAYLVLIFSYELFLIPRSLQTLRSHDVSLFMKITVVYFVFGYLSYNMNEALILGNYGVHETLVNNLIGLARQFYNEHPEAVMGKGNIKQFMWLTRLWFFVGTFIPVTNVLNVFRQPELPPLLTSLFPNPSLVPKKLKLLIALYHLLIIGMHFYLAIFDGLTVILFAFVFVNMVKDLRIKSSNTNQVILIDRWMVYQFQRYHTLMSIFQHNFNAVFGQWTLQTVITTTVGIIINIFVVMIYHKPRSFVIAAVGCFVLLLLYKNLGQLYEQSVRTLFSWRRVGRRGFRKYHRACQPLRVSVGAFYFADKSLMLTILAIILINSANMILTFRYD